MMRRIYAILGAVLVPTLLYAQTTVNVPSDNPPDIGHLNTAVQAAIDAGTLSSTVFQLDPYGYYVLTGTINVPAGQHLTIVAPEPGNTQTTAPPQILWTATGGVSTTFFFDCFGDLTLKNVWLLSANTLGNQVGSCIGMEDDPLAVNGRRIDFDGVILDYTASVNGSGSISVTCTHLKGTFKNSYWLNNIDRHLKYYGRIISFPFSTTGWHIDSLTFDNCTFANLGYGIMQEGAEYADYVKLNHCTFLNVMMFPLESGWWHNLAVTNCIFANVQMLGDIPSQLTGNPASATVRIDSISTFGFTPDPPFGEQDRRILFANSVYFLDPWIIDWMQNNPYSVSQHTQRLDDNIPVAEPMLGIGTKTFFDSVGAGGAKVFPYMNRANLDSVNVGFIYPPTDTGKAMDFMRRKWDDNTDTNWAWKPDNMINQIWPLEENLAYTNAAVKTAGFGGYPLGDLYRWWPTEYTQWKAQADAEDTRISAWLNTGQDPNNPNAVNQLPGAIPSKYTLDQNYPNPFNPTTWIKYSVPKQAFVSLKVYNALGEEVRTLFEGEQGPGNYVATFAATDLASGVYFYRLESGTVSITKKLVLMK
jgi:hypothetical protein